MFFGSFFSVLVSMALQSSTGSIKNVASAIEPDSPIEELSKVKIPEELKWLTNEKFPEIGSPEAKKGGTLRMQLSSFPQTFRVVGPNANTGFRSFILGNRMSLISYHPYTKEIVPELATHWAFGKDNKTVYYKLDKKARWSDGRSVTAHDFLYILKFMRSKHINAPWYTNYYTEKIKKIEAYDNYTISITTGDAKPQDELMNITSLHPIPVHFYRELDENWERDYNWAIEPNTGPYELTDYKKGKYLIMERKKDWWASKNRYYENRFNVDRVVFKVIRNPQIAYVHFKKGEIDFYPIVRPKWWHNKARGKLYDNGMIHKRWFYVTIPEGVGGFFMNFNHRLLKDSNIRKGIAHSINMEGMIADVLKGDYERKQRITEGFEKYDNTNIKARKFDLEKADEYFKKAGFVERGKDGIRIKDGQRLSFKVNFGFEGHLPRLAYIREEAKKTGLELVLELLDPVTNYRKTSTKEHEIGWTHYGGGGLKPRYHQFFHSSYAGKPDNNNLCEVNDPELDKMIMSYREEFDPVKSVELAHEIQEYIYELCPIVYNYNIPYHRFAYWQYWKFPEIAAGKFSEILFEPFLGYGLSESGGGLFWLDEEEKAKTLTEKILGSDGEPVTIIDEIFKPGQGK